MAENLVLGLFGGLVQRGTTGTGSDIEYDPAAVGQGPMSLNLLSPKKSGAYLDIAKYLSWQRVKDKQNGHYFDEAGEASDSLIPELVDRFPNGMPILYLRANAGVSYNAALGAPTALDNNVITKRNYGGQYQIEQITGYTGAFSGTWPSLTLDAAVPAGSSSRSIGEQKSLQKGAQYSNGGAAIPTPSNLYHGLRNTSGPGNASMSKGQPKYQYPYDAYPYFTNPSLSTTNAITGAGDVARKKDEYILISPGPDRIYGTDDDITNFGTVGE
jgi:hypothetical protein